MYISRLKKSKTDTFKKFICNYSFVWRIENKFLRYACFLLFFPFTLLRGIFNFSCFVFSKTFFRRIFNGFLEGFFEVHALHACNLRCKYCAVGIDRLEPVINKNELFSRNGNIDVKVDAEATVNNVKYLSEIFDSIEWVSLSGGEPLLLKKMPDFMMELLAYENIKMVKFVTNGTIIPSNELLEICKNPRVTIAIDKYGTASTKYEEIIKALESKGIKYEVWTNADLSLNPWTDLGNFSFRNRSTKELKKIYRTCSPDCRIFVDSRYYFCQRTWMMDAFGIKKAPSEDYIDVKHDGSKKQIKELRKRFVNSNKKTFVDACNYCNGFRTCHSPTVPTGEQMPKNQYRDMFTDEIKTFE